MSVSGHSDQVPECPNGSNRYTSTRLPACPGIRTADWPTLIQLGSDLFQHLRMGF
jgi:hypothetical protein